MRFRSRVTMTVVATTVVTLGLTFFAVVVAFSSLQERQLDEAILETATREAAHAAVSAMRFSDLPGPAANAVGPFPKFGVIYDREGNVVATTDAFASGAPPPAMHELERRHERFFDLSFGDTRLRGVVVAVPGTSNRLFFAAPRDDVDDDEQFLKRAMLLAFVLAAGWSVLITSLVVARLTRDHGDIAAVVRRVARGDLSARIGARRSDREVAQLAEDIDVMIERLGELLASQRQFIANAAHELRSPLTAIHVELQHARRSAKDADTYALAVDEALSGTRRLRSLADDLLSLARASADRQPAAVVHVGVREVLDEATTSVAPLARERGLEIAVDCAPTVTLLAVRADLARMVRNLVENAIRHAPEGSRVGVVGRFGADDACEIEVSDEGAGIPAEMREQVFEPFYRGPSERPDGDGAGLGLSIAREIARAHGGELTLVPTGHGATFVARLPRRATASRL